MRKKVGIVLVAVFWLGLAHSTSTAADPVAYWPFEEVIGGMTPEVVGGNNGNLEGGMGAGSLVAGVFGGNALHFDGSDDAVVAPISSIPLGDFTLSFWFNTGVHGQRVMQVTWDGTYGLDVKMGNGTIGWDDEGMGAGVTVLSSGTYGNNSWHHMAITRSGSTLTGYIDGGTEMITGPADTRVANYDIRVGKRQNRNHFPGNLDEVALWDCVLPLGQSGDAAGASVIGVYERGVQAQGVAVPDVVGMSEADAAAAITDAGLTVGATEYECSDTVPGGSVISQNPPAGTEVDPGSALNLVVSTGPCTIPVNFDIKPGSCPNPLNVGSRGVIPAAVLGAEDFDV
ncbi:MAG TPA: PASTA domain-containing protein, partial [Sedimentisphaerales bacterium]|nr:PASTA domain-containing protein [Sedimentisphaerales bacterium]